MRYIEIDGKRYTVSECFKCPCMDGGDGGWGARCRHPEASGDEVDYFASKVSDWCPLREVEE